MKIVAHLTTVLLVASACGAAPLSVRQFGIKYDRAAAATLDAYSRFRDGPIFVDSNSTLQVASLDVPAGLYVIFAKGVATDHPKNTGGNELHCILSAGQDFDRANVGVEGRLLDDAQLRGDTQTFALNVLHQFNSPGTITLTCTATLGGNPVDVSFIKITAMRVNSYSSLPQ